MDPGNDSCGASDEDAPAWWSSSGEAGGVNLPGIPSSVFEVLLKQANAQGIKRFALVGGAVRDALLHRDHRQPWSGLPDLDLVLEGSTQALAEAILAELGPDRVPELRFHDCFGTVEILIDGVWLDLAQSRQEHYPAPGENPVVQPGPLELDLARRDFSINAMAFLLAPPSSSSLLDRHDGERDLAARNLSFLHAESVADDPTRVIRGARYGARLGFDLSPSSLEQLQKTLECWPWSWQRGDPPNEAPPALSTRLRMELEVLFQREPWPQALGLLQQWGALVLLDAQLQDDLHLHRHLHWAQRLDLPLLCAFVALASDPLALSSRLQLPQIQQRWLREQKAFAFWLANEVLPQPWGDWSPAVWSDRLESQPWRPEVVALAISRGVACWRPLLRWWGRWRHLKSPISGLDLIEQGWIPGPKLGAELRRARLQSLETLR